MNNIVMIWKERRARKRERKFDVARDDALIELLFYSAEDFLSLDCRCRHTCVLPNCLLRRIFKRIAFFIISTMIWNVEYKITKCDLKRVPLMFLRQHSSLADSSWWLRLCVCACTQSGLWRSSQACLFNAKLFSIVWTWICLRTFNIRGNCFK